MTSTSTLPFSLANPSTEPAFAPLEDARRATLDLRLGAVLRGAAKGLAFEAAELWLLDDATKRLRRRAAWQDGDRDVAGAPQRVLVDAEADLAALAGGAVVLEDRATTRRWRLHRSAGAAVGVPVSSDLTIHGVLWLLCDSAREFGDGEVELIEVVAGRLALELERDALLVDAPRERLAPKEPTSLVAELPTRSPAVEDLELAGWTSAACGVAMHDWLALEDGRVMALAAAVLDCPGVASESALLAAQATRVAARAHASQANDAGELLSLIGATLVGCNASGEGLSIAVALIDGRGQNGSYAAAGPAIVLRSRPGQTDSWVCEAAPLGWDNDAVYAPRLVKLAENERLILLAGDPGLMSPILERRLGDTLRALTSEGHVSLSARDSLRRLRMAGAEDLHAATAIRRR
ncbi:MAG: GAF domain-containing protein [Lacipirellulaceae bacterium]